MKTTKTEGKLVLVFVYACLLSTAVQSQLVNKGSSITITSGAVIFTSGSFINTNTGTIINNGEMIAGADVINDTNAILSGNGIYSIQGNFTNNGTYNQDSSTLNFFGSANSGLKNKSKNIYILQVNKDSNYLVDLLDNEKVFKSVIFLNDNSWVRLNNKTLTLNVNCTIDSFNNKRYFITNGTGNLKKLKVKDSPFIFPVGFNTQTYNRLTITENGTPDAYSVRCLESALLNGATGVPISTTGINAGWVINETVEGGANAVIEAQWDTPDELPGFDYTKCMLVRYTDNAWDFKPILAGIATGTTFKSIIRSGLSDFGNFTVLSNEHPSFAIKQSIASASQSYVAGNSENLKIYPTLVRNSFNIDIPTNYKQHQKMNIRIINAGGQIAWVKQNADFASQRISLPDVSPGIYMVLVDYDQKKFVQQIMISR